MLKWTPILGNLLSRKVWSTNMYLPLEWISMKRSKRKWNPNKSSSSPSIFQPQPISPSTKDHRPILPSCLSWGRETAAREFNTPSWIKTNFYSTVNLKSAQRSWPISWGYHLNRDIFYYFCFGPYVYINHGLLPLEMSQNLYSRWNSSLARWISGLHLFLSLSLPTLPTLPLVPGQWGAHLHQKRTKIFSWNLSPLIRQCWAFRKALLLILMS